MSHTAKQLLTLAEHDPVMADWIEKEKHRQWSGLEMVRICAHFFLFFSVLALHAKKEATHTHHTAKLAKTFVYRAHKHNRLRRRT